MEEKIITVALLAASLLASVIAVFLYVINRQHKQITIWQEARVKAEITTLESERKRIAIDMHDDIGPILSSIRMQISAVDCVDEIDIAAIAKSNSQIDEVINKFRAISTSLLPNALLRNGLEEAIQEFIARIEHPYLSIKLNYNVAYLNEHTQINIYRIIQEIIHNTIKHAKASLLIIDLLQQGNSILIVTKDDGIGFTVQAKSDVKSIGMLSIQSRIYLLNGSYNITSTIGKGTKYEIKIPVNEQS